MGTLPAGERERERESATVLVRLWRWRAITAVLAIEDYCRAGKQELSHTCDTRFLPHLKRLILPPPSPLPPLIRRPAVRSPTVSQQRCPAVLKGRGMIVFSQVRSSYKHAASLVVILAFIPHYIVTGWGYFKNMVLGRGPMRWMKKEDFHF